MASWTGGYIEFHEQAGLGNHERPKLDGPAAPEFRCDVCGDSFWTEAERSRHRFEKHPRTRPVLVVRRRALLLAPGVNVISSSLRGEDIAVLGATAITVNGAKADEALLKRELCASRATVLAVGLVQAGIESPYRIRLDIADTADLKAIDALFFDLVENGGMTVERVRDLVTLARRHRTGGRYVDGLAQYLFGIMAKQQSGDTHIPFEEYRRRYNAALSALSEFDTSIATTIVGLVNFTENVFDGFAGLAHAPRLHAATQYFQAVLFGGGKPAAVARTLGERVAGRVPADEATEHIVTWVNEMAASGSLQDEGLLTSGLQDGTYAPDDHFKLCVLLAESCVPAGRANEARDFARPYTGHPVFGRWADRFFEHTSSV